jgi:hypothetical protein
VVALSDPAFGFDAPLRWTADMRVTPDWHGVGSDTRQGPGRTAVSPAHATTTTVTAAAAAAELDRRRAAAGTRPPPHTSTSVVGLGALDAPEVDPMVHTTLYAHVLRSELLGDAQLDRLGGLHTASARSFRQPTTTTAATAASAHSSPVSPSAQASPSARSSPGSSTTRESRAQWGGPRPARNAQNRLTTTSSPHRSPRLHSSTLGRYTRQLLRSRVPAVREVPRVPFRVGIFVRVIAVHL